MAVIWKGQRRRGLLVYFLICAMVVGLFGRLCYLMLGKAHQYSDKALDVQQRERLIKAERGKILDRNGVVLAGNKPVSTISVIYSQVKEPEKIIETLSELLELDEEEVRKKVTKKSSREKIKSNVEKEVSDKIRKLNLAGVVVDEDYKRYYPYDSLASKVIGFTGADNQGIIGLEVTYDEILEGKSGKILTMTNAKGVEIEGKAEEREEPVAGNNLYCTIDVNLQKYAQQAAQKVMQAKNAKSVRIIMMNPQNGEIYAMVNAPEFDLNHPFELTGKKKVSAKKKQELLNQMWRNACVSDTYEPGSTFKIITATAALETGAVTQEDTFQCPGYKIVEDRRIRCHKTTGHGTETFRQGIQNSCNPVFIEVGARVGTTRFYQYLSKLKILEETKIDVPGEAKTIIHKQKNVGAVELATMSFGQSFQLSPIRLLTTVSSIVNGGKTVVPHFGMWYENEEQTVVKRLTYEGGEQIVSEETAKQMQDLLESVVSEGSGKKAAVVGYEVGAKTGTSEKLPRSSKKYIASTIGFAPAKDPKIIAIVLIDEPEGIYYGGQIAAPVISELLEDALPYLGVEPSEKSEENKAGQSLY